MVMLGLCALYFEGTKQQGQRGQWGEWFITLFLLEIQT